jgi:hypothetical protein
MSAETLKWGLCGVAVGMVFSIGILVTDSACSSKQSSLSMTMHPQSTAHFELGRYIQVKAGNGDLEVSRY